MLALTTDNRVRAVALSMLEKRVEDLGDKADLVLSEMGWVLQEADDLHMLASEFLARIGSREYTQRRAWGIVKQATQQVAEEQAKRRAKKR